MNPSNEEGLMEAPQINFQLKLLQIIHGIKTHSRCHAHPANKIPGAI
jgi:hypothetical protein